MWLLILKIHLAISLFTFILTLSWIYSILKDIIKENPDMLERYDSNGWSKALFSFTGIRLIAFCMIPVGNILWCGLILFSGNKFDDITKERILQLCQVT